MRQNEPQPQDGGAETQVSGTLERFRFRNAETGFAVARVLPDGRAQPITAVGLLAQLTEGQRVRLTGKLVSHPRFGSQLEVALAEAVAPSTAEGIEAYLGQKLVKGIGPATARKIVQRFGTDALRVIEEEPDRLRAVPGLGQKKIDELAAAVRAGKEVQQVMVFLRTHGLGPGLAARIVKRYGKGASALIEADPYRLVDEVVGIGFRTADQIAGRLGVAADAPSRVQAGVLHRLTVAAGEGHCCLAEDELVPGALDLLGCPPEAVTAQMPELVRQGRIVREAPAAATALVYPIALHRAEVGVAQRLDALLRARRPPLPFAPGEVLDAHLRGEHRAIPEGQRLALHRALTEPVSVITGGPGVGKTTIVRALTEILTAHGVEVRLAAPTGRAAKRLEESTQHEARTIHRLLEWQPGTHRFARNDQDPLDGAFLVVDECSMLDVQLAYALLRALPPAMRLVLVGDVDQLPAVGPGNVLHDVIQSRRVAVTALTEIFRQSRDSRIVASAHGMLRGEIPRGGGEGSDFYVIETRDSARAREVVRELVTARIPKAFGLDALRDVQVLCPMYRGECGADAINRDLQTALNPEQPDVERAGRAFRLGDKVMQVRNDYDLDVFNGDSGRIVYLDAPAEKMLVRYGDRVVEYGLDDLAQIVPAYAITVHRAQGSEYPAVVVPLVNEHFMMLRRNLLYTAITRGKRLVVLVGSSKALAMAVRNDQESARGSRLGERLAALA